MATQAGNIVANLKLKVNEFKKGMSDAKKELTNFSDTTKSIASGVGKALKAATVATAAGLSAIGVGAVKAAADAETQLAKMTTAFQGNTKAAKEYVEWAKEFGKTTPFEASEVVDATIKLKSYGIDAKKTLETIGNMAAGMGKGLDQAVEAVADAQTGELERLKEFGITKQMLIDKALALGKGEIVNAKGQITDMEALNEALLAIMDERFKGGMERQSKTFNGQLSTLKDNWTTFLASIGEGILPTLSEALGKVNAWIEQIDFQKVAEIASSVFNTIVNVISKVVDVLVSTTKFVIENKEAFALLGAVIAGVVIPPILGFILHAGVLKAKALWGLIQNTYKMIVANYQLGISYLMAYGHILLIIAGIALLVAGIIWLVKNWDTVKEKILQVWEAIKSYLAGVWDWIKSAFQAFLDWIVNLWNTIWNAIKTVAITIWEGIKNYFITVWNAIWNVISTVLAVIYAIIMTVWEGIKALAMAIWGVIGDFIIGIWNGIKAAAEFIWNALVTYFTTVLNIYKTIFTTVWNAIKSVLEVVWNAIKTAAMFVWDAIKTYFTTVLNIYKTIFTTVWNAIKTVVTTIWNAISTAATTVFNAIKNVITSVMNTIKSIITSVWNGIKSVTSSVWNGISSVLSSIVNGIRSKIQGAANFMQNTFGGAINAVKGFFGGLWNSISQSLQNVVNGIKQKVQAAKEWLTELNPFKRHSPSLVDNVLAGTKIIKQTYESLGGLQIAPPEIGSLTAGRIDMETAFGSLGSGGSGNGGGTNYNAPLVQVENMNVRNDQDVRNVSRELFNLQRSHDRAKGGR